MSLPASSARFAGALARRADRRPWYLEAWHKILYAHHLNWLIPKASAWGFFYAPKTRGTLVSRQRFPLFRATYSLSISEPQL